MLTVIIPSHNEENYIEVCLDAVVAQVDLPLDHGTQVIVAANGCRDKTVALARAKEPAFNDLGFELVVLDISRGNKVDALNAAEEVAIFSTRVFLDADVVISERILRELADILGEDGPLYASGTVRVPLPQSIISRAYAKVWTNLPFVREGVPGMGLYAVNGKGRERWSKFPATFSEDRFVRLQFAPHERHRTNATYEFPMPEGLSNLLKVRRRWSENNSELGKMYPMLIDNESEINRTFGSALSLFRTPLSSTVFILVHLIENIRIKKDGKAEAKLWSRGRD